MGSARQPIRRLNARDTTYTEFADIMAENEPVILFNIAELLPSFTAWQHDGRAETDLLRRKYGDMQVPVVDCSAQGGYGEQHRASMSLREYLDRVRGDGVSGEGSPPETRLYLKDWHFPRMSRALQASEVDPTQAPHFFSDDWLNSWCDAREVDDYRFVYIGPSGTWTPLHHDVLNSYSWSFNVCGSKQWIMFPPETTPDLYDRHRRDLATDVRRGHFDPEEFPGLETADRLEVLQGPGDAIFVPSGWHHQVINASDARDPAGLTISVNTNWFNGFNLDRVFSFLSAELDAVREALGHLREEMPGGDEREWERQCEVIMRANSALNLTEFAAIIISRARHLLASSLGSASSNDDGPSDYKPTGFQGKAASKGSEDLRRRKVALRQAADVLEKLAMEPCLSHLFLRHCDGIHGDGPMEDPRGSKEDEEDATDLDCARLLHQARSSIERFLGEALYRTTPENNCT